MTALSQATHFLSFKKQQIAIPIGNKIIAQRIPKMKKFE